MPRKRREKTKRRPRPPSHPSPSIQRPPATISLEVNLKPRGTTLEFHIKDPRFSKELRDWVQQCWNKGRPIEIPGYRIQPSGPLQVPSRTFNLIPEEGPFAKFLAGDFPISTLPGLLKIGGLFAVIPQHNSFPRFIPPQPHIPVSEVIPTAGFTRVIKEVDRIDVINREDPTPLGAYLADDLTRKIHNTKAIEKILRAFPLKVPLVVPHVAAWALEQTKSQPRFGILITQEPQNQLMILELFSQQPEKSSPLSRAIHKLYYSLGESIAWLHFYARAFHMQLHASNLRVIIVDNTPIFVMRDFETVHNAQVDDLPTRVPGTTLSKDDLVKIARSYIAYLSRIEAETLFFSQFILPLSRIVRVRPGLRTRKILLTSISAFIEGHNSMVLTLIARNPATGRQIATLRKATEEMLTPHIDNISRAIQRAGRTRTHIKPQIEEPLKEIIHLFANYEALLFALTKADLSPPLEVFQPPLI